MDNHANRPEIITALAGQTGKSLRFWMPAGSK
jgi:hypothetical protein